MARGGSAADLLDFVHADRADDARGVERDDLSLVVVDRDANDAYVALPLELGLDRLRCPALGSLDPIDFPDLEKTLDVDSGGDSSVKLPPVPQTFLDVQLEIFKPGSALPVASTGNRKQVRREP